jgi:hypothetical protein
MLKEIQSSLDQMLGQDSASILLVEDSDDDYDSDIMSEGADLSTEATDQEPAWEYEESSTAGPIAGPIAGPRSAMQFSSEDLAIEHMLENFDFQHYASRAVIQLSGQLLQFLISTLQKEAELQFDHELLAFLAMISMDFKAKSFKAPGVVAQAYSAMIYYFQLVIIEASILHGANSGPSGPSGSSTALPSGSSTALPSRSSAALPSGSSTALYTAPPSGSSRSAIISWYMDHYCHNHANTAMGSILAWRALALGISKNSSGIYNEVFALPGEKISFQNITLSRQDLGDFFQKLIGQATTILVKHLLIKPAWWHEIRDSISLAQASSFENIQNREAYWNFLAENPYMPKLGQFIYMHILQDQDLGAKWFTPRGQLHASAMTKYYSHLYDFQVILMVLIYSTSGGPPRGSEVPPILIANTPQATRTLFIDKKHHLFLLRLRYSKTANKNNIEQQAIRVLPESVSYILLVYMAIVLPFIQFLEVMHQQQYSRARELLFFHREDLMHERILGQKLKAFSHQIIGQRVSIRGFRHMIQGFIRYYMAWDLQDP